MDQKLRRIRFADGRCRELKRKLAKGTFVGEDFDSCQARIYHRAALHIIEIDAESFVLFRRSIVGDLHNDLLLCHVAVIPG